MVSLDFDLTHAFKTLLVWYNTILLWWILRCHVLKAIAHHSIVLCIRLTNLAHFLVRHLFLLTIWVWRHCKHIVLKCLWNIHSIFSCYSAVHNSFIFYWRHFVTILICASTQLVLNLIMPQIVSLRTCSTQNLHLVTTRALCVS